MMISHDSFPKLKAYVFLKGAIAEESSESSLTHHFDLSGLSEFL